MKRFQKRIERSGLTIERVAATLGYSVGELRGMLNGTLQPPPGLWGDVGDVLDEFEADRGHPHGRVSLVVPRAGRLAL